MKHSQEITIGLKKAKSHLTKVIEMVESKQYCINIMQQVLAIIGLLRAANSKLMVDHLNNCFARAMKASSESRKRQMIDEILQVEKMSNK